MQNNSRLRQPNCPTILAILATLLLTCVCSEPPDQRLTQMASQSLAEQSRQNDRLAQQTQQIAAASKQLVEADAQARQQLIAANSAIQRDIQASRENIERQRDELEHERREIANQRITEPIIAEAISLLGLTLACSMPLLLAAYVLYTVNRAKNPDEVAMSDFLIEDIVAERPVLLSAASPAPRLEHSAGPRST